MIPSDDDDDDGYPDYYGLLGVSIDTSIEVIKAAYQRRMKQCYLGLCSSDLRIRRRAEWLATKLLEAFDVLSDPIRRQQYDQARWDASSAWEALPVEVWYTSASTGADTSNNQPGPPLSALSGPRWLGMLLQWLSEQRARGDHKQVMGPLTKALLFPIPFSGATAISALFWHLGQSTGQGFLGGVTSVLAYPLLLIPLLVRLLLPIRYRPLLRVRRHKLAWTPVVLAAATILGWLWMAFVDHNGATTNPLDLYYWCGLLIAVCATLAYL
jgi:hypothetical protein